MAPRPQRIPAAARRRRLSALRAPFAAAAALWAVAGPWGGPMSGPWTAPVAQAQQVSRDPVPELAGTYKGLGSARGMELRINEGTRPGGFFRDSNGTEAEIGGGWRDGGLEFLLNFPGRPVFARAVPVTLGLQLTVVPFGADGAPDGAEARILAFVREGVRVPEQPPLYQPAPVRDDGESDPDVFLASYQFWEPDGVVNGFSNIGARYRTILRMFPQVHADVLWKLCQSARRQDLVAEALRGQGARCADILETVDRLQRSGRFTAWKQAVEQQIAELIVPVQCARGYVVREAICAPASRRIADAAVSLETVGSALARWR
ncbi:MAG: hypothetical protein AAF192_16950 [Pseudomonadota bacterium]